MQVADRYRLNLSGGIEVIRLRLVAALMLAGGLVWPAVAQQKGKQKEKEKPAPAKPAAQPASQAGGTLLKWEFQKDKPIYQEVTTISRQTMKILGMSMPDINQDQSQTFVFSWTPKEQDKDKNWIVNQKIEAIKMEMRIADNKLTFDSTKDAQSAQNPLSDFFKALNGSEFKLVISPDFKVLRIEGRDDFLNKLIKANTQMESLLKQILSDETLKQMADNAFAALPNRAVQKGDTWERNSTANMGPIGSYKTLNTFTYEGEEGKFHKIKVVTTLDYTPPGANSSGALPFKIKSADLKARNATGTILYDPERRWIDSSDSKLLLEGKLTLDLNGQTQDVQLTQEQETKAKTTDTNPTKK
jgi:hypothetical protein